MRFQCLRDGVCCRSLFVNMLDQYQVGLFLLPHETKLFSAVDVSPVWAAGLKGHSRPRPNPVIYQLNRNVCPHITKDNRCSIYKRRPLICRAHPLTIHPDDTAEVNLKCPGCQQQKIVGLTAKLTEIFDAEIINANLTIHAYLNKAFSRSDKVFLFDLKTRTWQTIETKEATEIAEAIKPFK